MIKYYSNNYGESYLFIDINNNILLLKNDWADIGKLLLDGYTINELLSLFNDFIDDKEKFNISCKTLIEKFKSIEVGNFDWTFWN